MHHEYGGYLKAPVLKAGHPGSCLFNLLPQFSRLGTQGPASHVVVACDFVSV